MSENQNARAVCLPRRNPQEWVRSKFRIDPENVSRLVYPLARFVHEEKPDYVLALDSGGRITGLVLLALYNRLYNEVFPTRDILIHFEKISHGFPPALVRSQLRPHIDQALSLSDSPLLFIVDDCVNTGTTTLMMRYLAAELSNGKVRLRVGVMREFLTGVTDVRGDSFSLARATWRNNPSMIGVEYPQKTVPRVVRTGEAVKLRQQILDQTREFAALIQKYEERNN